MFSEKYLKHKHYLEVGNIIYLNWKANKSFRDPDALDIDINSMGVLADLKDKYTQITLQLLEREISEKFVNELVSIVQKHPGKCTLRIVLNAEDHTLSVQTIAGLNKVETSPEFLKEVERLIGDRYKLN